MLPTLQIFFTHKIQKVCKYVKKPFLIISLLAGNCDNVKWITRDQWGAKAPKKALGKVEDFKYLVVHHTSTYTDGICVLTHEEGLGRRKLCKDGVKDVQNKHMDDRGYDDIGYNFLIDRFGNVYEGIYTFIIIYCEPNEHC